MKLSNTATWSRPYARVKNNPLLPTSYIHCATIVDMIDFFASPSLAMSRVAQWCFLIDSSDSIDSNVDIAFNKVELSEVGSTSLFSLMGASDNNVDNGDNSSGKTISVVYLPNAHDITALEKQLAHLQSIYADPSVYVHIVCACADKKSRTALDKITKKAGVKKRNVHTVYTEKQIEHCVSTLLLRRGFSNREVSTLCTMWTAQTGKEGLHTIASTVLDIWNKGALYQWVKDSRESAANTASSRDTLHKLVVMCAAQVDTSFPPPWEWEKALKKSTFSDFSQHLLSFAHHYSYYFMLTTMNKSFSRALMHALSSTDMTATIGRKKLTYPTVSTLYSIVDTALTRVNAGERKIDNRYFSEIVVVLWMSIYGEGE